MCTTQSVQWTNDRIFSEWLDFGGDADSFTDSGSSKSLYHQEIGDSTEIPLCLPGGSTIVSGGLRALVASVCRREEEEHFA